jgi:thiamine biosynthesis lipoprotein
MIVHLRTRAMATTFEVVLAGDDEAGLRAAGEAAMEEVADCDRRLSRFRRDSLVTHLCRVAPSRPVPLDEDTFELLADCAAVHRASEGAFDVTVGALMDAGGFHDGGPSRECSVGADAIELDEQARTVRFTRPVALDLGAVGKGHALDLAATVLREAGVDRALLHGGTSTAVAIGAPLDAAGWSVQIQGGPAIEIADCALSVSAAGGRRNGAGDGHVLDPHTGRSAADGGSAAVTAPTARLADCWSTALLVLRAAGREELARDRLRDDRIQVIA